MDILLLIPAALCAYECWHRWKKNPIKTMPGDPPTLWAAVKPRAWMVTWGLAAVICLAGAFL